MSDTAIPAGGHDAGIDTDDRRQLQDSARRFVERGYGFEVRRRGLASPEGFSEDLWRQFAELGWLGLGLPEACGGFGHAADQAALAEELGRAGVVEPWLANVALAGPLLATSAQPAHHAVVERMVGGELRLALAAYEPGARFDAFDVATHARPDAGGWTLEGRKTLVLGGGSAHALLVLARTSGERRDTDGLSLFVVGRETPGLDVRGLPTYDGRQTAELRLTGVRVADDARVGDLGRAWPAVEAAIDRATAIACAEAVGAMQRALELTREYLATRRQFGRTIVEYQVIRHRLVDLFVAIEQSRAITEAAAAALDDEPARRRRAVSIAKAFVSEAGRKVGEEGVQLHGAIGMTDEVEVGHCYKRLAATANLFGDVAWHQARLADAHL
jgi:butyryl-CoA dehydrogenase